MADVFAPLLSPPLQQHLAGIDVMALSRLDAARLAARAIPHIGTIELVSGEDFGRRYDALYTRSFPQRTERERSDLVVARLASQAAGERGGLAPFRVVGLRDRGGEPIGAAQFSVLPLRGADLVVPYLQYIYVRPESRRRDMSEVLHAVTLAVAVADARAVGPEMAVPFTLFETEPSGHGDEEEGRAFSVVRAQVHARGGAVAVVLKKGDGEVVSPHVQPGLEVGDPPLSLLWAVRESPRPGAEWAIGDVGPRLMSAYYRSLRDEGFPEENISLAERMVRERCEGAEWALMPLHEATFQHP